jgi:hypothetical protein
MFFEEQAKLDICPKAADGVHQYFEIKKLLKHTPEDEAYNKEIDERFGKGEFNDNVDRGLIVIEN